MRSNGKMHPKKGGGADNGTPDGVSHDLVDTDATENRSPKGGNVIVVIDRRRLLRECLVRCIEARCHREVMALHNIEEWVELGQTRLASLFVLCITNPDSDETKREVERVLQVAEGTPTAALSDSTDFDHIVGILGQGVRGYIPMDFSLDVAIAALGLVAAGGTFVPATSLVGAQRDTPQVEQPAHATNVTFSPRQIAVLDRLRLGKANKVIAFDLAMREGTVKVHVRNIMKKLNARNRTEVAILANNILNSNGKNGRAGQL